MFFGTLLFWRLYGLLQPSCDSGSTGGSISLKTESIIHTNFHCDHLFLLQSYLSFMLSHCFSFIQDIMPSGTLGVPPSPDFCSAKAVLSESPVLPAAVITAELQFLWDRAQDQVNKSHHTIQHSYTYGKFPRFCLNPKCLWFRRFFGAVDVIHSVWLKVFWWNIFPVYQWV